MTGAGRSGTSSVAGALSMLGMHLPGPLKAPDELNPRGYFEASWSAAFHARWMKAIPVRTVDTRPHAVDLVMATVDDERRQRLTEWLAEKIAVAPAGRPILIKETRAYLAFPLWRETCRAVGAELKTLTMVRHPAQVVRSRDSAWLAKMSDERRRQREGANVAAWINALLITEEVTQPHTRCFVSYEELITDWRGALGTAAAQLGVGLDHHGASEVDDFLTTDLNRSATGWEGLEVTPTLQAQAERTWEAAQALCLSPTGPGEAALRELRTWYADMYELAVPLAFDDTLVQTIAAKSDFQERLDAKNARIQQLRDRLRSSNHPGN